MRAQGLVHPMRLARAGALSHCPLCERTFPRFKRVTDSPFGLECPRCGSRPRHRLLWMFLLNEELLARPGVRILHFAPEPFLAARLRTRLAQVVTVDLEDPNADVRADITELPFDDREFDLLICSHVLEPVADDRRAMRELRRVLDPRVRQSSSRPSIGGSPTRSRTRGSPRQKSACGSSHSAITRGCTARTSRIVSRGAGFDVFVTSYAEELPAGTVRRNGLVPHADPLRNDIYFCRPA